MGPNHTLGFHMAYKEFPSLTEVRWNIGCQLQYISSFIPCYFRIASEYSGEQHLSTLWDTFTEPDFSQVYPTLKIRALPMTQAEFSELDFRNLFFFWLLPSMNFTVWNTSSLCLHDCVKPIKYNSVIPKTVSTIAKYRSSPNKIFYIVRHTEKLLVCIFPVILKYKSQSSASLVEESLSVHSSKLVLPLQSFIFFI